MVEVGPVLEARGLSKWYGEHTALDGVDLTLDRGVVHGLLGPNGAGKTTLLAAVFGLVLPDEGTLRLFGRTRAEAGAGWLEGVGGFVETPRFYPYLSGRRNLLTLARLDGGDSPDLVDDVLDVVGLTSAAGQKARGYSLGMRQRLGVAAALLRRPRLLVLDEPTNGLDPSGIRDLLAALRRLADDGLAVLLSSHDVAQVEGVCDAVTVLRHGSVAFAGPLSRMCADAPDPAWLLQTADDEVALETAHGVAEVKAEARDAGGLRVVAAQDRLDAYVVALGRAGVAVRALAPDGTPLEAVFFRLTEDPQARG